MQTLRDFTDFTKFGGKIVKGIYKYPTLFSTTATGSKRKWNIFIRLVKKKKTYQPMANNWNLNKEESIPIKESHLKNEDIPEGFIAQFWIETGVIDGAIVRHPPTYAEPCNVGRANERNSLKHALVMTRAKYEMQKNKGGKTRSDLEKKPTSSSEMMYFPMLARKYDDEWKSIKYPCVLQPKLDGVRCVAYLNSNKSVVLYSRNLKQFDGFKQLREELLPVLLAFYDATKKESLYLDGEFYEHGKALQEITGIVRNVEKNNGEYPNLKFHIFDCFYPSKFAMEYKDRLVILGKVFERTIFKTIEPVKLFTVDSPDAATKIYKALINDKYEGVMYKNLSAPYLASDVKNTAIRSYDVLKRKKEDTEEFKIVDFTEGAKGKDRGAIIWICETKDGKQFKVTPINISYEDRHLMFEQANTDKGNGFKKLFAGKMLTVKFQDLSKNGIPLRAKGLAIRDYE